MILEVFSNLGDSVIPGADLEQLFHHLHISWKKPSSSGTGAERRKGKVGSSIRGLCMATSVPPSSAKPLHPGGSRWDHRIIESQKGWVRRNLKDHPAPLPACAGCPQLRLPRAHPWP